MRQWVAVVLILCAGAAFARTYKDTDPIPAGATAKVLPLSGKVLEIRGLASVVSGKSESLAAALRDLGAQRVGTQVHIALSSDVLFDFDRATLRPEATPALEKVALVINSYEHASITVEGHSDSVGNDRYNQTLSERRASAVREWLAKHNVNAPIETRGWGESKPVVPNTNNDGTDHPQNRAKNRRVEIIVKTE